MKFCKECGHNMKEEAQFCNSCGTPVKQTKKSSDPSQVRQTVKQPLSKKTKRLLIISGVAIVLLFAGYKVGGALTSETRLIEKFEKALLENDSKAVAKLLSSNDKKVTIDEKSVKGLLKYYKENPEQVRGTIDVLENQSRVLKTANTSKDFSIEDMFNEFASSSMINLEKDGKILFYDKYELNIDPVYLQLGTNYKDTVLFVDGKEVGKADQPEYEATFGPFLPGYHDVEAKLKTDFIDLAIKEEIFLDEYNDKQSEYIEIEADEVTVSLPEGIKKASLLINGKDVGVNPIENPTFGPVLTDGTMKIQVVSELPWGKTTSKETPITSDYVQVNILSEETQDQLMDTVHNYYTQYGEAYTKMDASKVTTATKALVDSIMREAKNDKEYKYNRKIKYISTNFDLDNVQIEKLEDHWAAYITGETKSNVAYGYDGSDLEMEEYENGCNFQLIYDEDKKNWLLNEVNSAYYYDLEAANTKELKVKEPITYTTDWTIESEDKEESEEASADVSADYTKVSNSGNVPEGFVEITESYLNGLVSAINNKDFDEVAPYMLEGSELYKSQKKLVENLGGKDVKEQIVSADITDYWSEGGDATITTSETIKIIYSDGTSETKEYNWVYSGTESGNGFVLTDIAQD
ncbi:zinc ribbon domain-containing protein [Bacillus weihaiensis]|uniref:zinc ribbon domain-containing protein n=1 Tax=Bacillus weihaiensis TaxID=1547283 RepID=UPI00235743F5|nr:zinc-ribbon domain-containing protein [Bacillus weihaiensis]